MVSLNILLFRYLAVEFLKKLALVACLLMGVVYLFEVIDLFNRIDRDDEVPLISVFQMAFYKLPDVGHQIFPFIILFATMTTLRTLSDRSELVILRTAGLSVWQFLAPLVMVTLVVSVLYITVLHPLFSAMMSHYERMQNIYYGDGTETITRIDDGLWLRQEDETGNFILKAGTLDATQWIMRDIVVFFFDQDNMHSQRIDAAAAQLLDGEWDFNDVSVHQTGSSQASLPSLKLTTTLTPETIEDSFTAPQAISFWRLPHFISALEPTGLDTQELQSYYQSLLSTPLFFMAMVFMAGVVTLKTGRFVRLFPLVAMGLGCTVAIFFFSSFLQALATGEAIPLIMAVWTPPILILLLSIYVLSHKEDG